MKKMFTLIVVMDVVALAALAVAFIRDRMFVITRLNEVKLQIMSILPQIGAKAKVIRSLPLRYYIIAAATLIIMTLVFKVIGKVFGK